MSTSQDIIKCSSYNYYMWSRMRTLSPLYVATLTVQTAVVLPSNLGRYIATSDHGKKEIMAPLYVATLSNNSKRASRVSIPYRGFTSCGNIFEKIDFTSLCTYVFRD